MYKLKILILILLINTISGLYLKCDIYNYDYYYVPEISNIYKNIFENFNNTILIDNEVFYLNSQDYNTTKYMGSAKIVNGTDNKNYIINMLNNKKFYTKYDYAVGSHDNRLKKWISISSNIYKYGTKVYIKEFNKTISINNKDVKHNGCFRIDDDNNNYNNCFIRIFTGERIYNKNINTNIITMKEMNNCPLIDYV